MSRLLFALCLIGIAMPALAQPAKPTKPKWLYAHDLKVRNVDEKNFSEKTPKVGVEFFHDATGNALVAISEAGHIAVAPFGTMTDQKKAEWITGLVMRVRDASVSELKDGKQVGMESFKDLGSGNLLYVTGQKALAFADAPRSMKADQDPAYHHALVLAVRPPGDKEFNSAKKFGLECYKDGNTGGLIYVSDQGFVATATAPGTAPDPNNVKKPKVLTGLALKARKADEGDFTDKTKVYGLEIYSDPNTGALLYVSETGSLAALPAEEIKKDAGVKWSHAFALKVRKGGEKGFDNAAKYGIEVFEDKTTGALIYICKNGSIAVLKK
jgi:hypothetical protein